MAMLVTVGHMGHNHGATAPEIITGQIDEEKKLLALMDGIQSETKEQAQHHIYSFKDYAVMAEQAKWLMNIRTHHALNDWKECGFETAEYRLGTSTPWTPMSAVKQELLPMVSQLVASSPDLFRTRRMSPAEAWETSIKSIPGGLRRISAVDVCDILGKHTQEHYVSIYNRLAAYLGVPPIKDRTWSEMDKAIHLLDDAMQRYEYKCDDLAEIVRDQLHLSCTGRNVYQVLRNYAAVQHVEHLMYTVINRGREDARKLASETGQETYEPHADPRTMPPGGLRGHVGAVIVDEFPASNPSTSRGWHNTARFPF